MNEETQNPPEFSAKAPIAITGTLKKASAPKSHSPHQIFWLFVSTMLALIAVTLAGLSYYQLYQNKNTNSDFIIPPQAIVDIQQLLTADQTQLQQQEVTLLSLQKQIASIKKSDTPGHIKWITQQRTELQSQLGMLQAESTALHLQLSKSLLLSHQDKSWVTVELQQATMLLQNTSNMADDINSLQLITKQVAGLPDLQNATVLTGLQQLQTLLTTLKFKLPITQRPTAIVTPPNSSIWQQSLAKLRSLVVIHHNAAVSKQLITTEDRLNALRIIQVWISAAMLSATQGDSEQYHHNMTQLIAAINLYTQPDAAQSTWLAQATQLSTQSVGYSLQQLQPILAGIDALINHLQAVQK